MVTQKIAQTQYPCGFAADELVLRSRPVTVLAATGADPASDATFERLPSGLFRLTVAPYGQGDDGQVFEFRPDS